MESKLDRRIWARGYYVTTIGNVNKETVEEFVRCQTEESKTKRAKHGLFKRQEKNGL